MEEDRGQKEEATNLQISTFSGAFRYVPPSFLLWRAGTHTPHAAALKVVASSWHQDEKIKKKMTRKAFVFVEGTRMFDLSLLQSGHQRPVTATVAPLSIFHTQFEMGHTHYIFDSKSSVYSFGLNHVINTWLNHVSDHLCCFSLAITVF